MATVELLLELFEDFGFDLKTDVVEKCLEFSVTYDVEPRELVETFVAYCVNHLNGVEPTVSSLDEFERKQLQKQNAGSKRTSVAVRQPQRPPIVMDDFNSDSDADDDVMSAYICNTPKAKEKIASDNTRTPVQDAKISRMLDTTMDSPITKDASGKVVCTFGNAALLKSITWTNTKKPTVKIDRCPCSNVNNNNGPLAADQNYMLDTMEHRSNIAADRIYDIGQQICYKLIHDTSTNFTAELYNQIVEVDIKKASTINTIGRIAGEGAGIDEEKLHLSTTILLGADEEELRTVRLNFNRMKSFAKPFSVFPGQTVMVQGLNPRGDSLFVDNIYAERVLTHANAPHIADDLHIVVASGPFTSAADLNYEPLSELHGYCKQHKPDVVILMGPFLDADHPLIQDLSMKPSFETYFDNLVAHIVENIGSSSEIIIVSSSQDIHSSAAYPTNPYASKVPFKNVTFLPDPSLVKINDVTIALTATDAFNHMLDAELSEFAGDKVKRIVNHLFHQASFYPLNPPSSKIAYDAGLAERFATLPVVPNLFVMSSSAKYFIRDVSNCLAINTGHLIDDTTRGTFSRIFIKQSSDTKVLSNFVACQIVRL